MARYNTQLPVTLISSTTTLGTPLQGSALVEFTGTTYTVTLYSPAGFPGAVQTFYNAASGSITLSTPSGSFVIPNGTTASTYVMNANSTITITSDGTNFIVETGQNGPLTATTLSSSSTTTLSPANANVTISPTGTGNVVMNPATAGTIDNMAVGGSTAAAGRFTTLTATNTTTLQQITEVLYQIGSYGTSQSVAFTNGDVYYLSGMTGNFTFNWTSVPTTSNRTLTLTLILGQGGTAYIPTTLQINSSTVGINWAGGVTPSGRASKIDIVSFYLYNLSGSFVAVGQLGSYG
jgi:hypothetical protein